MTNSQPPPSPTLAGGWRRDVHSRDPAWNQPCGGPVNNKIDGAKCLVNMVRAQGGKIDGMGMQGHYFYNATPSVQTLPRIMNDFAAMDLNVAVTELDIRMDLGNINDYSIPQQTKGYESIVGACRDTARCVGITLWDFANCYSWVTKALSHFGSALPWDNNLVLKQKIYDGMMQAWGACG
jgi:endo-1,4-beta-xylanase